MIIVILCKIIKHPIQTNLFFKYEFLNNCKFAALEYNIALNNTTYNELLVNAFFFSDISFNRFIINKKKLSDQLNKFVNI